MDVLEWSSEPAGERWCDVCHATQYAWALLRITPDGVNLERFEWDCLCNGDPEVD